MRWGGIGNGSFGVGATAYTLASRDKNSSYYYYHEPLAPVTASSAFGVPRQVHAKKPDKRQGRRIIGSNARSSKGRVEENSSGSLETEPESTPLIMCAGKSFYGTTSDLSCSEDRDNNDSIQQSDDNPRQNNQSPPFRAISAVKTTLMELDSPPRHRTDEELEQIIRELRDQVFQKPNQDLVQVKTLKASVKTDNTANQTQKRPRKHLKNPIEKMEAVVARVPSTTSIESNPISNRLQRPLSSSQLNRIMAENTIQIAVPAVIYDASQATANRVTSNQISTLDFSSLRQKSRPNSSSGCLTREKQSLNPRHRSKQTSASIRTRRKGRELDHSSDCGESFLYLVDVDSDDDVESLALSPVGPWVVDDFSVAPETPRSPVSTCFSVSSLGSEDLDNNSGEWSNELAAKSPRSRLLYFSACADNSETSRCTTPEFQHQSLRRSATSRSSLGTRTSLESRIVKLKRCASAHVSTRGKIRPSSSSTTSRVNPVKRPQSGGTRSYRSSQSDESTR